MPATRTSLNAGPHPDQQRSTPLRARTPKPCPETAKNAPPPHPLAQHGSNAARRKNMCMPTRTNKNANSLTADQNRPIVADVSTAENPAQDTLELYDFHRRATLAREHSRVLELAFETFARQWGTQLTSKIRVVASITSEQVNMVTYDEYAAALPSTTAMVLCELAGMEAKGVIQFPTSAALGWVAHMVGGNGSRNPEERKFTQIEQTLVRSLMEDALEDLRYSLGALLSTEISIGTMQYNAQFAQAAKPADTMLVTNFTIRVGERTCSATLALPADLLLPQMGLNTKTVSVEDAKQMVLEQIAQVPIELTMALHPTTVMPGQILHLAVGDIIALPHSENTPFEISVNGESLGQASVASKGSRLACVIVNTEETTR